MKKTILSMLLAMIVVGVNAQTDKGIPLFEISPLGDFRSPDGKDYIIYSIEGKNAHEIFQMICTNVGKVYNSPKSVMSTVEDNSVAIRALSTDMVISHTIFGVVCYYECHYNLMFEIKDGRVKIHAPTIGRMWIADKEKYFSDVAKKCFDKDSSIKEKRKEWKSYTETKINIIINLLLGTTDKETNEDDW